MKKLNLFHELCETALNDFEYDDGITGSHIIHSEAYGRLHDMADHETIDRCLKKLGEKRRKASHENNNE